MKKTNRTKKKMEKTDMEKLVAEAIRQVILKYEETEKFFKENPGIFEEAGRIRDAIEKIAGDMGVELTQAQLDDVLVEFMQLERKAIAKD